MRRPSFDAAQKDIPRKDMFCVVGRRELCYNRIGLL